jgi:hypothetical protein
MLYIPLPSTYLKMEEIKYEKRKPLKEWNFDKIGTQNKDLRYQKEIHVVPDVKPKARRSGLCNIFTYTGSTSIMGFTPWKVIHHPDLPSLSSPGTVIFDVSIASIVSLTGFDPNAVQAMSGISSYDTKIWIDLLVAMDPYIPEGAYLNGINGPTNKWRSGLIELDFDPINITASFNRIVYLYSTDPLGTGGSNVGGWAAIDNSTLVGSYYTGTGVGWLQTIDTLHPSTYSPDPPPNLSTTDLFTTVNTWNSTIEAIYLPSSNTYVTSEAIDGPGIGGIYHYDSLGNLLGSTGDLGFYPNAIFYYDGDVYFINSYPAELWILDLTTYTTSLSSQTVDSSMWVGNASSNPYDCIPPPPSGCMDPVALNYDPLAIADCNGDIGGVNITCCTYPCHQQP